MLTQTTPRFPFILRVAKFFSVIGAVIVFILGVIGLVSCFYNWGYYQTGHNHAVCIGTTAVAVVVGLIILATEASRRPYGILNNTLVRAVVWIVLVIVPFWGWWSWLGSCLVILGAIFYAFAFCCGHQFVYADKVILVGAQQPANYYEPGQGQQIQINNSKTTAGQPAVVSEPYADPYRPTAGRIVPTTPVATTVV